MSAQSIAATYFSDNCRAFAVDRKPTDEQLKAAEMLTRRPEDRRSDGQTRGVRCREIFDAV